MAASPDVLVIGGGIIGLTAAVELATAGLKVGVCDKSDLGQEASWAGAGIIPPGNFARAATPFDQLRAWSSERFPAFCQRLHADTSIDPGYRACGGVEYLEREDIYALALWQLEGIEFRKLRNDQKKESVESYLLPGMAQVRNPRLIKALIAACQRLKVQLHPGYTLESFEVCDTAIENAFFSKGVTQNVSPFFMLRASHYLIATGAWADPLLSKLNCELGIHPVRGQILQYRTTPEAVTHILIHGKRYVVPRGDGVVLVGSTEEPEAGFEKNTTAEGLDELRTFAEGMVPELRHATLERSWAGLRPGSRDGQPFIGYVPGCSNLLAAVGHFRSGIGLSLGTARMIRELILKQAPTIEPAPFRLDRPPAPARKPAFRS